jgi:hypothetical protein
VIISTTSAVISFIELAGSIFVPTYNGYESTTCSSAHIAEMEASLPRLTSYWILGWWERLNAARNEAPVNSLPSAMSCLGDQG